MEAGGHIGPVSTSVLAQEILPELALDVPIFVAGGIGRGEAIASYLEMGAAGVQMATRFVATEECDADPAFKQTYVDAKESDLTIISSPVGMPGRALKGPFLDEVTAGKKTPYVCPYHCIVTCDPQTPPYCISLALRNAQKGNLKYGFAFAGANAWRVNKIMKVAELVDELEREYAAASA